MCSKNQQKYGSLYRGVREEKTKKKSTRACKEREVERVNYNVSES